MNCGKFVFVVLLFCTLQGCATWKPEGAYAVDDVVSDSALNDLQRSTAQVLVLVLVDPSALEEPIVKSAEGFAGSSCTVSFTLYPELYMQAYKKLSTLYSRVDIAELGKSIANYDVVVSPVIDDVQWGAGSVSSNLAAVALRFTIQGQPGMEPLTAYQMAKWDIGRWHNGCQDATDSALRAAREGVGLAVNRLVVDLANRPLTTLAKAATKLQDPDESHFTLLAKLEASRKQMGSLKGEQDHAALIAAGLDLTGAVFDLKGQSASAQYSRQMASNLRGKGSGPPGSGGVRGQVGSGNLAAPQGISVPTEAGTASCDGDYAFLGPYLRPYQNHLLAGIRNKMLKASVPEIMTAMRKHERGGESPAVIMRGQAANSEQIAQQSAQSANQTDGYGNVSISKAESDTLPLEFACDNTANIHAGMVCNYILYRWNSLFERTSADLYERCS